MLKSLVQFNAERRAAIADSDHPVLNGIACPKCGAECTDSKGVILTSNLPQTPIACTKCSFVGSRIS